jgi:hypothetical protein
MHDDSVLVAIDDATRRPRFCNCGSYLAVVTTQDALWLECPAYTAPTRLPAAVASVIRSILHDREFVVEIPEALRTPVAPAKADAAKRVATQVSAARA